jgi:hypothetical protein
MHCMRCGRTLKREGFNGMGPVCARVAFGAKPRKEPKPDVVRDELTMPMFADEEPAQLEAA